MNPYNDARQMKYLNYGTITLSMVFSVLLFWSAGSNIFGKTMLGCSAVLMELIKVAMLKRFKTELNHANIARKDPEMKMGKPLPRYISATGKGIIFVGLTLVSVVASIAFSRAEIERQYSVATTESYEMDSLLLQKESIQASITRKETLSDEIIADRSELGTYYFTRRDEYDALLATTEAEIVALYAEMDTINVEIVALQAVTETAALDVFALLGEMVGMTAAQVLGVLLAIMTVSLELGIFVTTETGEKTINIKENKENFDIYLEALTDIKDGNKRLHADSKVAAATGLPLSVCKNFKNAMLSMSYQGRALIEVVDGSTNLGEGWSKDSVRKIVRTKYM